MPTYSYNIAKSSKIKKNDKECHLENAVDIIVGKEVADHRFWEIQGLKKSKIKRYTYLVFYQSKATHTKRRKQQEDM